MAGSLEPTRQTTISRYLGGQVSTYFILNTIAMAAFFYAFRLQTPRCEGIVDKFLDLVCNSIPSISERIMLMKAVALRSPDICYLKIFYCSQAIFLAIIFVVCCIVVALKISELSNDNHIVIALSALIGFMAILTAPNSNTQPVGLYGFHIDDTGYFIPQEVLVYAVTGFLLSIFFSNLFLLISKARNRELKH